MYHDHEAPHDGYTYFVQCPEGGAIKIGWTSNEPERRIKQLLTGSPVPLQLIGLLTGNRERELH